MQASLMRFGFAVGEGWKDLVENLCDIIYNEVKHSNQRYELCVKWLAEGKKRKDIFLFVERRIDYPQVEQVKEKFGGLRFYIGGTSIEISDTIHGAIALAERLSYLICEDCGNKGHLRDDLGWYRTLCDTHYKKLKIARKKKLNEL